MIYAKSADLSLWPENTVLDTKIRATVMKFSKFKVHRANSLDCGVVRHRTQKKMKNWRTLMMFEIMGSISEPIDKHCTILFCAFFFFSSSSSSSFFILWFALRGRLLHRWLIRSPVYTDTSSWCPSDSVLHLQKQDTIRKMVNCVWAFSCTHSSSCSISWSIQNAMPTIFWDCWMPTDSNYDSN